MFPDILSALIATWIAFIVAAWWRRYRERAKAKQTSFRESLRVVVSESPFYVVVCIAAAALCVLVVASTMIEFGASGLIGTNIYFQLPTVAQLPWYDFRTLMMLIVEVLSAGLLSLGTTSMAIASGFVFDLFKAANTAHEKQLRDEIAKLSGQSAGS